VGGTPIDELDHRIMAALRQDGRMPALELARLLNAPEATVRKRLKRLLDQGLLRIVAVSSARALGYTREVHFTIRTEPGRSLEVARRLAEADAVRFVAFGVGAFDLVVNVIVRDDAELFEFVTRRLAIDGIVSHQSTDLMAVFKRSFDWLVDQKLAGGGTPSGED
jgi:Lrp/AsnC family transcriptional regulator, regulator for asnA, asnC and gidA